jgi:hypothetical protein
MSIPPGAVEGEKTGEKEPACILHVQIFAAHKLLLVYYKYHVFFSFPVQMEFVKLEQRSGHA